MSVIICDYRLPERMKITLSNYYDLVLFSAKGLVESPLDGHPDIFISKLPEQYIIAPNTPKQIIDCFASNHSKWKFGNKDVGFSYPQIASYNISVSENFLICNLEICDKSILELLTNKKIIHVKQGFCRCSTLALKNDVFITSDNGIHKTLQKNDVKSYFFPSDSIRLDGYKHGLLGGCLGIDEKENRLIISGNLDYFENGKYLKSIFQKLDYQIIELDSCPLLDVGGFFVI